MDLELLGRIDAYLDAVPRASARTEIIGPFTLFVTKGPGWPYYARPTPHADATTARDIERVRARQRELGVPESFEWIVDLAPGVGPAAAAAGLEVVEHPLMRLALGTFRPAPSPPGTSVELAAATADLERLHAVSMLAFSTPGTGIEPIGHDDVERATAEVDTAIVASVRERMTRGLTVTAVASAEGRPVAVGSHNPMGDATEIVGVGTLPAFRRRGLGAAVTSELVRDATRSGISTVLLSAGDEAIARVYARLGFERVGTAGAAEPPVA